MKINCIHCAYPLAPDGLCRRCMTQQEPHPGTWPEYYKAEARFLEPCDTSFWCLCIVTLLVVFISLLSLL